MDGNVNRREQAEGDGGREKVLGETTRTGGPLGGCIETWCSRNSLECTKLTQAKPPSNGGYGVQIGHPL